MIDVFSILLTASVYVVSWVYIFLGGEVRLGPSYSDPV